MKPLKLNLKNFQTIGSEDTAMRHCVVYSLVETYRMLGVSVMRYFRELFTRLSHTPKDQRGELLTVWQHVPLKSINNPFLQEAYDAEVPDSRDFL